MKLYYPSMYNFNVTIVDCSYMFRFLHSTHHQAVYQKRKEEIILDINSGRDRYSTKVITSTGIYLLLFEKPLQI
jgi:hypothetical protein